MDLRRVLQKPGNGQGDSHLSATEKPEETRPFHTVSQTHTQAASTLWEHSHEAYLEQYFTCLTRIQQMPSPQFPHSLILLSFPSFPNFALLSVSQASLTPIRKVGEKSAVTFPHQLYEIRPTTRSQSWTEILSGLKQVGSDGLNTCCMLLRLFTTTWEGA